jgi:hypothetical protein
MLKEKNTAIHETVLDGCIVVYLCKDNVSEILRIFQGVFIDVSAMNDQVVEYVMESF